jgi:hypothetical protein
LIAESKDWFPAKEVQFASQESLQASIVKPPEGDFVCGFFIVKSGYRDFCCRLDLSLGRSGLHSIQALR